MEERLDRLRWPLTILLLAAMLAGVVAWVVLQPSPAPLSIVEPIPTGSAAIKVYVSGAVAQPGVYSLPAGQRVEEALAAAGGPLPEADLDSLNLAVRLRDEMQVKVPYRVAATGSPALGVVGPTADLLDLNSASQAELEALPGIGPVTAGKILTYRSEHGRFQSVEELLDAKLVGRSTFEDIRDLVAVR